MEIITFFIIIPMLVAFIANNSMQTPFGAIIAAGVVAFFAFIGGASFLNQVSIAIQEQLAELRVSGQEPAEFDTYDKFYHAYGICCSENGRCRSCFTQYTERLIDVHEFDRQFNQAFAE